MKEFVYAILVIIVACVSMDYFGGLTIPLWKQIFYEVLGASTLYFIQITSKYHS